MRISDWSSDVCSSDLPSVLSRQVWPAWHEALIRAHADPADASARERLGYDELFANQLALMLVRASTRRRPGLSLQGDGRLTGALRLPYRSEEHTSELQSLMRISYAVFCLKKKKQ